MLKLIVDKTRGVWGYGKKLYMTGREYIVPTKVADAAIASRLPGLSVIEVAEEAKVDEQGSEPACPEVSVEEPPQPSAPEAEPFVAEVDPVPVTMTTDDLLTDPKSRGARRPGSGGGKR